MENFKAKFFENLGWRVLSVCIIMGMVCLSKPIFFNYPEGNAVWLLVAFLEGILSFMYFFVPAVLEGFFLILKEIVKRKY